MVMDSASIILFAIRSAVKLGRQARKAYVDSTRRREIVLPLSNYFSSTSYMDALNYFRDLEFGKKYVEGYTFDGQVYESSEILKELLSKAPDALTDNDKKELNALHMKYANLDRARDGELTWADDMTINAEEFEAIFTVGQWRSGADPTPSALHRMAGTLIEVGVDYALNSPDLYDKNSKKGKAVHSFLTGLDDIDFPETDLLELPARLFVATVETVSENPSLFSGDLKIQEFIRVTTRSFSMDVAQKIKAINDDNTLDVIAKREARLKVQDWGELIYRSTLSLGGRLIMSDPAKFLKIKDAGDQALISSLGNSVFDLIIEDGIEDVFSREGLEVVIGSALKVIGEHPGIITEMNNKGVKTLISEFAKELSKADDLLTLDILPELVRMTMEKSGENLELFWPDLANDPGNNLMLTAAKTTLATVNRPPEDNEPWKTRFTKSDLLAVTESVLDELVANPGWLITEADELSETLGEVLSGTVDVLRKHGTNRLSSSMGVEIIREVLKTVALRQEFTDKLPNGQMIIVAAVDTVLSGIFKKDMNKKASWQLLRTEVIKGTIELSMEKLALTTGLDQDAVKDLRECLDAQIAVMNEGSVNVLDSFAGCLNDKFDLA